MTIYWVLVITMLFSHLMFFYFHVSRKKGFHLEDIDSIENAYMKVEKDTITVFFTFYIVILCLRDLFVGSDTIEYVYNFNQYRLLDWSQIVARKPDELAFSFVTKIIGQVTSNPQLFLSVFAILSVAPIMILYKREARDAVLCCSFYLISLLFEFYFSGIRQGVAIGFMVPAYYFVKEKKPIQFVITLIVASSFHISALIGILLYPIYHAKITTKWLWFVVPIMALIYRFNQPIFNTLFLLSGEKYSTKYIIWGFGETGQYGLLLLFVLLSIYSFLMLDESQADGDDIGLRNVLLLATVLQFFSPLHSLASRMNYYFILFIPIAITRVNYKSKIRYKQIAKLAKVVMVVYFLFYFFVLKGDSLGIFNYKFCF